MQNLTLNNVVFSTPSDPKNVIFQAWQFGAVVNLLTNYTYCYTKPERMES